MAVFQDLFNFTLEKYCQSITFSLAGARRPHAKIPTSEKEFLVEAWRRTSLPHFPESEWQTIQLGEGT